MQLICLLLHRWTAVYTKQQLICLLQYRWTAVYTKNGLFPRELDYRWRWTAVTRTAHYLVTISTSPKFLCTCTMLIEIKPKIHIWVLFYSNPPGRQAIFQFHRSLSTPRLDWIVYTLADFFLTTFAAFFPPTFGVFFCRLFFHIFRLFLWY